MLIGWGNGASDIVFLRDRQKDDAFVCEYVIAIVTKRFDRLKQNFSHKFSDAKSR